MRLASIILVLGVVGCDQASGTGASSGTLPRTIPGEGIIRGVVSFTGTPPPMRTFTATEKCCQGDPPIVEESVVVNSNQTLRNVFVFLEGAPKTDGSELPPALLDQVRCSYVPHVLGVQVGQLLRVRSSDPTMHNVHYTPDKNNSRNLSMTQSGQEVPVSFTAAEFIRMKCDVHPWMTAWVGVFDNPFFAVTQHQGTFEIKGIPNGTYKLVAWHELYGRREKTVTVVDEQPMEVKFEIGNQAG
jgi:hypothetical protein